MPPRPPASSPPPPLQPFALSGLPRRWMRAGCAAAAALLLAGLAACGGGGAGSIGAEPAAVAAPPEGALRAARPGDLVAYFQDRLLQRAALGLPGTDLVVAVAATSGAPASPAFAGTGLQEQGVDEDDLIKTDGATVYALHPAYATAEEAVPARLTAHRRLADGTLGERLTETLRPDFAPRGMYLNAAAGQLAVLSQRDAYQPVIVAPAVDTRSQVPQPPALVQHVALDLFAVAGSGRPVPATRIEIDGTLVASRMIGSMLYVVSQWAPDLAAYQLPANATATQTMATLLALGGASLLPRIRVDDAPSQPLVAEADCLLPPASTAQDVQLTTITAFDLSTPGMRRASRCFLGSVEALYMSPAHLYLTRPRQAPLGDGPSIAMFTPALSTDIHKFALQGLQVDYRGSGEVAGHLGWDAEKKPYRLSEHQGDLRVLSYTGSTGWFSAWTLAATRQTQTQTVSPATLTVLRENAASRSLEVVATLPNARRPAPLGHAGEQVYAVQFAGPMAYLVTFRRTDPLYLLDLSDPADPRTVGELAVPGYSDYLYPLGNGKLLGVGRDATADGRVLGLKLGLFDVGRPAQPTLLAGRTLGDAGSMSALDFTRHGINLLTQGDQVQVALPVRLSDAVGGAARGMRQGLARFTVDTAAGTLAERPLVLATRFDASSADLARYIRYELAKERSVQTAAGAYYLSGGELVFAP